MKKFLGFFLSVAILLAGCMSSNIEDSSVYQPEGFKKYENPDIYIEESLISQPESLKKHAASEKKPNRSDERPTGPDSIQPKSMNFEWVAGPDRDTTWQEAVSWVQSLPVEGGGWRMPSIKELRIIYQTGDTFILSNTTGRWVWSTDTKGDVAWLFSFRYGIDKKARRSQSNSHRAFAIRNRKH